jgi:inorganic pyrophosphatase
MNDELLAYLKQNFRPHPWHGIPVWSEEKPYINVYIEIVPSDTVKYELDKSSGYLSIDRPQKFSNIIPFLYGFVPRTYCDTLIAQGAARKTKMETVIGDRDPLDICVLTERPITHGDLLLKAKPIGGLLMIDKGEADDKIIAVLKDDPIYGDLEDIEDCPPKILARMKHYFLTYKDFPDDGERKIKIPAMYGRNEALQVIDLATQDYLNAFPPKTSWR